MNKVQTAIYNSEYTLRNELISFFAVNPPVGIEKLDSANAKRHVEKEITKTLANIKLPNASNLISKIKLNHMYYDLTIEDLNDIDFLKWFIDRGLISTEDESKLASFSNAFEVRN